MKFSRFSRFSVMNTYYELTSKSFSCIHICMLQLVYSFIYKAYLYEVMALPSFHTWIHMINEFIYEICPFYWWLHLWSNHMHAKSCQQKNCLRDWVRNNSNNPHKMQSILKICIYMFAQNINNANNHMIQKIQKIK